MITRENYEEYFLLYIDNELPVAAKSAVEKFIADNPDLQEEWETLLQCRVHPSRQEVFPDKESLLQHNLLSYIDGELDEEGRREVEEFVVRYPSKAVELQQLSMTVSHPDLSIVCPDKESLLSSEKRRFVLMPWMQAGIAAAVLGIVALLLLTSRHSAVEPPRMAKNDAIKKKAQATVTPATVAPLYSSGSDDKGQVQATAKNDPQKRKGPRKAEQPARVEKEANVVPRQQEVVLRQQEVARTTTAATTTDSRVSDPAAITEIHADVAEKTLIKPATTVAAVTIPKEQSSFATQALMKEAQEEESKEMLAAAPAGKSKLRGLFRKVSRTFGKTADRDGDGQKEVLISAFQVALK